MSKVSTLYQMVTGPSAGLVMRHYAKQRIEDLRRVDPGLETSIVSAIRVYPLFEKWLKALGTEEKRLPEILDIYAEINHRLKQAELTINFDAESWFKQENTYTRYLQAYERTGWNSETGRVELKGSQNDTADLRARADDRVTFAGLRNARDGDKRAKFGRLTMNEMKQKMEFGRGGKQRDDGDDNFVAAGNSSFDPAAKQIFAALNFGRRRHGSNTNYGSSHMVLSEKIKVNALYYPGDTFNHGDGGKQVAFGMLAAVIGMNLQRVLLDDIIKSCYSGSVLDDTSEPARMIEGHVFRKVRFADGDVVKMVLGERSGATIRDNARKFAKKFGIKLETP